MSRLRSFYWAALVVLCGATPAFADTVFTDNTFNLGGYTVVGPVVSGSNVTIAATQCANCGFPAGGKALQISGTFIGAGTSETGFLGNAFTYNPGTQGAILSIGASVEKDLFSTASSSNAFHPLIEQDGIYYVATIAGPSLAAGGSTGYQLISESGLLASDFSEYNFATGVETAGVNPNFHGDAMTFGLAQFSSNTSGTEVVTVDYDNLNLDLSTAGVPEPASWSLLALGLAGVLGISTRKLLLS
jgi:PEP-CTERM motif-containing protein